MSSHGKTLRNYLRVNDISIDIFTEKIAKSRQTVYNWFEKDVFDDTIIERLEQKAGISKDIFGQKESNPERKGLDTVASLSKEVEYLKEMIKLKDELIEELRYARHDEPKRKKNLG